MIQDSQQNFTEGKSHLINIAAFYDGVTTSLDGKWLQMSFFCTSVKPLKWLYSPTTSLSLIWREMDLIAWTVW